MKSGRIIILTVLLIAVLALAGTASAEVTEDDRLIHVSGTGKVTTDPDVVKITIAVETENTDAVKAQQENAERMTKTVSSLKALGLTDDEISTAGYNIYSYTTGSDSPFGKDKKIYKVTNTVLVETNRIDLAGDIIDASVMNGANRINSIYFTLSDEKSQSLRSEAITAAVEQAKLDADAVSAALGVEISGVKSVNVGSSYTPYSYSNSMDYAVMEKSAGGMAAPTPVQPDTVDVTASVSIDYLIM
jgi:uncharacterized protein YggE